MLVTAIALVGSMLLLCLVLWLLRLLFEATYLRWFPVPESSPEPLRQAPAAQSSSSGEIAAAITAAVTMFRGSRRKG